MKHSEYSSEKANLLRINEQTKALEAQKASAGRRRRLPADLGDNHSALAFNNAGQGEDERRWGIEDEEVEKRGRGV